MFQCKIAHIADIHIKNKYVEYYNLLDILHNDRPDIIVLAGDIIDSIININPAVILDVTTFLSSLTSIAPIVMIPGNHDISCKVDDVDFFTAITHGNDLLKPPKFNYWRHSGQYEFKNILWTVIAPDEDIPEYTFDIRPQILLFHENLDRLNLDTFNVFSAVMAGHIHTRQLIGNNGAYCGSLFQQNINETHNDHGFIMWEIFNNFAQINYVDVKNNFGFLKVELEYDSDVTELPIPDKVTLYDIYYNSTSPEFLTESINKYTKMYSFKPRNIKDKNKYNIESLHNETTDIDSLVNLNDIAVHNMLIRNYLGNNEYLHDIIDLHKRYYMSYYNYQDSNNGKLRILTLAFENMYNFEGPNYVDFTKLENKLSGIIGLNNIGKTALIDIILYALYDVHPRISSKKCIINKNCNSYSLTLEFEINGRSGIINKGSSYKFFYDGRDLTQKTIPQTCNEIKKVVGNYNDATLSSFQLQYNYVNFINMSSNSRKQKLAELLSLRVFENIESEVVKEISELNGKQKVINSLRTSEDITINEDKIRDIQHQIKYASMLGVDSNKTDRDDVENSDIQIYEDMIKTNQTITRLENERSVLYALIEENRSLIIDFPNAVEEHKNCHDEILKLREIIKSIESKIDQFEPKYIKDAVINKYNTFGISYLYKLCKVEKDEKNLSGPASIIACLLLERDHNIRLDETYSAKMILCEKVIVQLKHAEQIDSLNKTIADMKGTYNNLTKMVNSTNKLYFNLYEEYKKYIQKDIEAYRQKELAAVNKNLEILKLYRQIIKPSNGIISILLNNVCPKIEERVNTILVNTDIRIKIDTDFEILYDVNGHWLDISLSSGYQKFILNLVFRVVLWQFADVIIPDALVIDEGFGMCDNENISIITDMLQKIANSNDMPRLVFVVSHVDYLVNNIEAPLFIENGKVMAKHYVHFSEDLLDKLIDENNDINSNVIDNSNINISDLDAILNNIEGTEFITDINRVVRISEVTEITEFNISSESTDSIEQIEPAEPADHENTDKYYCDKCNIYVKISSKNKHLSSQKHRKYI